MAKNQASAAPRGCRLPLLSIRSVLFSFAVVQGTSRDVASGSSCVPRRTPVVLGPF